MYRWSFGVSNLSKWSTVTKTLRTTAIYVQKLMGSRFSLLKEVDRNELEEKKQLITATCSKNVSEGSLGPVMCT